MDGRPATAAARWRRWSWRSRTRRATSSRSRCFWSRTCCGSSRGPTAARLPLEFHLEIDPAPVGQSACLDAAGNVVTHAWFEGLHESLTITARSRRRDAARESRSTICPTAAARCCRRSTATRPTRCDPTCGARRPAAERADDVAVFAARMRAAAHGELLPLLVVAQPHDVRAAHAHPPRGGPRLVAGANVAGKVRRLPRPGVAVRRRVPRRRRGGPVRQRLRGLGRSAAKTYDLHALGRGVHSRRRLARVRSGARPGRRRSTTSPSPPRQRPPARCPSPARSAASGVDVDDRDRSRRRTPHRGVGVCKRVPCNRAAPARPRRICNCAAESPPIGGLSCTGGVLL